jgi:hypothetical protein
MILLKLEFGENLKSNRVPMMKKKIKTKQLVPMKLLMRHMILMQNCMGLISQNLIGLLGCWNQFRGLLFYLP